MTISADAAALRAGSGLLLQHGPVEDVVVLVAEGAEQDPEQLAQVHVVGGLFEAQPPAVVDVHRELGRVALAQHVWDRGCIKLT